MQLARRSHLSNGRSIPGARAAAVLYAIDQGRLELEGAHSAWLTEEGRRRIAREAH
jgi:hypothetical protein